MSGEAVDERAVAATPPDDHDMNARPQGLLFLIVGGWNTLFAYLLFAAVQLTIGKHVGYLIVLLICTFGAILNAYLCYRRFVFKVQGHWFRDLARFSTVYMGSFLANLALLPLAVEVVKIPVLVAQGVIMAGTVAVSFFAHREFSFRRRPGDAA
jgi:putative flippase GtrA